MSCFGGWNDCYHSKCHIRLLLHLETGEKVFLPTGLFCKSGKALPTLTLPLLPYRPDERTCSLWRTGWPWPSFLSEARRDLLRSTWSLHPANKQKYLARKKQKNSLGVGRQRHLLEYMVPDTKDIWTTSRGTCPWEEGHQCGSRCSGGVLL